MRSIGPHSPKCLATISGYKPLASGTGSIGYTLFFGAYLVSSYGKPRESQGLTLYILRDCNTPDVYCPILAHEAAYAAHVISVVAELVAAEAVHVRVEDIVGAWQSMEVRAVLALWAETAREEETEVAPRNLVGACVATILRDIASTLRLCLGQIFILSIAARPLIVPVVWLGTSAISEPGHG